VKLDYKRLRTLSPEAVALWEQRAEQAASNSKTDWWCPWIASSAPLRRDAERIAARHHLDAVQVREVLLDGLRVAYRRARKRR
jgi:hypothetical protein